MMCMVITYHVLKIEQVNVFSACFITSRTVRVCLIGKMSSFISLGLIYYKTKAGKYITEMIVYFHRACLSNCSYVEVTYWSWNLKSMFITVRGFLFVVDEVTDKDTEIVHHGESEQLAPCPEPWEQHHRDHSAGHAILFPTG